MHIRRKAWLIALIVGVFSAAGVNYRMFGLGSALTPALASERFFAFAPSLPADRFPEEYQGSFFYTSAEAMLEALQVKLYPEDRVMAFPDPTLGIGSKVFVYRAQPVLIRDGEDDRLVRTWAPTVADLAEEQRLDLAEKDLVVPARDSLLEASEQALQVVITRVAEAEVAVKSSSAFATEIKDDPELERGLTKKEQSGKTGILQKIYMVRRENGKEVSRNLISEKVLTKPINEIIRKGTKIISYGTGGASWYGGVPPMTAAHKTLPKGTKVKVVNLNNGKTVVVTIADRGPYIDGRIIDLSSDAFAQIAPLGAGVTNVRLEKE